MTRLVVFSVEENGYLSTDLDAEVEAANGRAGNCDLMTASGAGPGVQIQSGPRSPRTCAASDSLPKTQMLNGRISD